MVLFQPSIGVGAISGVVFVYRVRMLRNLKVVMGDLFVRPLSACPSKLDQPGV